MFGFLPVCLVSWSILGMSFQDLELEVPIFFQGRGTKRFLKSDLNGIRWSPVFRLYKTTFDMCCALAAMPVILLLAVLLLIVNPVLNPGPLMFVQKRMGRNRQAFYMYKFRTMLPSGDTARGPEAGLETDRITALGGFLRRTRVDELPNFINVLLGEMSVIGPRPDAIEHAEYFSQLIGHYNERFRVKPGITGLAQIEHGYADGAEATALKAMYDQRYVEASCGRLDVYIALRTIFVMASGFGAK
ncbi:sugar transferase [Amaricoccus tamworthensis]|uniref:sugar transferase n=1 Tax=Amaricoccus tamworthensis TaxID=57002 RepID=UPI003C7CA857